MNLTFRKPGRLIAAAIILTFLFLSVGFFSAPTVRADEAKEIWTYEDLQKMEEEPTGSYVLMADIDLTGKRWKPFDFSGTFDGGGHALLNLRVTSTGQITHSTYDGNMVEYSTTFAGLFSGLTNAVVSNLKVLGIDISIETSSPVFLGGITGFMDGSTITGCTVTGTETLYTSGASFGVGGIAGFGKGTIENTTADMTLVCVDTDKVNKDEQFMGGAYAAGYIDLRGNSITIRGYDSDHGYVHNGGLVGMYILYPQDDGYYGFVTGNTVAGSITFFEDNEDRRAYCEAYIGEIMNWSFEYDEAFSSDQFVSNEVFEYETDLLPHSCPDPQYETTVVESTETTNGYTEYRCPVCGYTYRADYKPVLGNPTKTVEPAVLTDEAETETQAAEETEKKGSSKFLLILIIVLVLLAGGGLAAVFISKKHTQQQSQQRKQAASARPVQQRRPNRYREESVQRSRPQARSERPRRQTAQNQPMQQNQADLYKRKIPQDRIIHAERSVTPNSRTQQNQAGPRSSSAQQNHSGSYRRDSQKRNRSNGDRRTEQRNDSRQRTGRRPEDVRKRNPKR